MYIHHIEMRTCNHRCSEKAISVTYSECVFVALGIHHAKHRCHTVICGLSGSTMFFHIISYTALFSKKLLNTKYVFYFLYNLCLKHFSFQEEMGYDHKRILVFIQSTHYSHQILMKLESS